MKIQSKTGSKEVFDFESKVARALIAGGTHIEYIPTEPVRVPKTTWEAKWIPAQLDIPREPVIIATCATCSGAQRMTGPTAHKTQKFLHCGVTEIVPRHISAQYAGMRKVLADERDARIEAAKPQVPTNVLNRF